MEYTEDEGMVSGILCSIYLSRTTRLRHPFINARLDDNMHSHSQ